MVTSWLLNSLSRYIGDSVLYFKIAEELWNDLEVRPYVLAFVIMEERRKWSRNTKMREGNSSSLVDDGNESPQYPRDGNRLKTPEYKSKK
ncbi:hypothetical protein H5410_046232, partial [Solanum commersonii]